MVSPKTAPVCSNIENRHESESPPLKGSAKPIFQTCFIQAEAELGFKPRYRLTLLIDFANAFSANRYLQAINDKCVNFMLSLNFAKYPFDFEGLYIEINRTR